MGLAAAPPASAAPASADLKWALRALTCRQEAYARGAAYYAGDHPLQFASLKFRSAFGGLFREFADNLTAPVVDAVADRLQVTGFDVEDAPAAQAAEAAWALWRQARLPRLANQVHQEALVTGDAYLIVWPDAAGHPVFYAQNASAVTVDYDPDAPGAVRRAAKWWRLEDGRCRLTLYYPERIEKYITRAKTHGGLPTSPTSFVPFEADGEPWPLPNAYAQVPVFHFANNGPIGGFGVSELRDVIPLQNALNKAILDMLVAMEYVAFPQRWATGLEVDFDPVTGKPKAPFDPGVDRLWTVAATDIKFGQFEPAKLDGFLEAQQNLRLEIARVSRTPIHYLLMQGQMPSGESLKTAEEPFVRKVRDRQLAFGDVWEDALGFALRVQGETVGGQLETLWEDAAPRAEKEHLESLQLKQGLGVSENQLLLEAGYTDDQVQRMRDERASLDVIPTTGQ